MIEQLYMKWAETKGHINQWFNGARISLYLAPFIVLSILASLPVTATIMFHYKDVITVVSAALFSPDTALCIQAREQNFCLITSETPFPCALRVLSELFGKLRVACNMAVTQWLPSSHSISQNWLLRVSEMDVLLARSPKPCRGTLILLECSLAFWSVLIMAQSFVFVLFAISLASSSSFLWQLPHIWSDVDFNEMVDAFA